MLLHSEIDENSYIPKYQQVARLIVSDIEMGIYKQGDRVPSINETSCELLIARETVEKAYKELMKSGIIASIKGKGYYVTKTDFSTQLRICLIFNKLSSYKKEIYDSFVKVLDKKAMIDLHIYNYNIKLFEKIINNNIKNYDYFVILPHFLPGSSGFEEMIRQIPSEKVIIVDNKISSLLTDYPTVYQDFQNDIIEALEAGIDLLKKYKSISLIYPPDRIFSPEIKSGFIRFCRTYDFQYHVIEDINHIKADKGNAYIVANDDDMVIFINSAREQHFTLGKEVGLISYNENAWKELIENGITTISTNHEKIGEQAAQLIISRKKDKIKIPFNFKRRNSL